MLYAGAEGRSEAETIGEVRCERPVFDAAIGRLRAAEVLIGAAGMLRASRCARHLDELGLIAI